jgi:hypothetical protein
VARVTVPREVFLAESSWDVKPEQEATLRAIKNAVGSAPGRVLGLPFWIQGDPDEHGYGRGPQGGFIMQFDEQLVPINTGDMGLVYVFTDGLLMQCH